MSLNTHNRMKVLFAGGGTGGHIFPGIALAQEFMQIKDKKIECLFVISSKDMDEYILKKEQYLYRKLPIKEINWSLSLKVFVYLYRFFLSFVKAWQIITHFHPDFIIGMGAYISFPVVVVGKLRGKTVFIQEQNILPGRANKILGRWVDGVFTSFPQTEKFFPKKRIKMLGNPIRHFTVIDQVKLRHEHNMDLNLLTLLVCGGSRGSHFINIRAMEALQIVRDKGFKNQIIHQTGMEDFNPVSDFYKKEGLKAIIKPFFDDMMEIYQLSDIIISRAGAGMIAEITAVGCPAIFIPYTHAKEHHQRLNALAMVEAGAARMIEETDCSADFLADTIMELIQDRRLLSEMGKASQRLARPNAARQICEQALHWFKDKTKEGAECIQN